jgi:hypothetical protein
MEDAGTRPFNLKDFRAGSGPVSPFTTIEIMTAPAGVQAEAGGPRPIVTVNF